MEKNCDNCSKIKECRIKESCKRIGNDYCKFYEGNGTTSKERDRLILFENAARPLIKWLCDNEHPNMTAIITSTSCELLEIKCANPRIKDYIK